MVGNFLLLNTHNFVKNVIAFTFECQAGFTMADIKQKYESKIFFEFVILDLKFFKNLGFSLSEHSE